MTHSLAEELCRTEDLAAVIDLRRYRSADLAAMVAIDAVCFDPDFLFGRPLMQRLAEAAQAMTLIAETPDGEVAGFTIAHCEQASAPETAYLVTLDVLPAMQSQGIGTLLLSKAEQLICNGGALQMDLHVYTENHAAIGFYERQGYTRRSHVKRFYGRHGRDAFLYSKRLKGPASINATPNVASPGGRT